MILWCSLVFGKNIKVHMGAYSNLGVLVTCFKVLIKTSRKWGPESGHDFAFWKTVQSQPQTCFITISQSFFLADGSNPGRWLCLIAGIRGARRPCARPTSLQLDKCKHVHGTLQCTVFSRLASNFEDFITYVAYVLVSNLALKTRHHGGNVSMILKT